MKKYDWKNEYNPIRRTAKLLLSGEPLTDGRPLSDLIELDEHTRKCLAFEATLTDRQIDMLQELGYLPVIMRQNGEECANCPYTLDEREHGISAEQLAYVTNADPGSGLLFFQNVILPFKDEFPKTTELYRLLTTKPSEVSHDGQTG